MSERIENGQGSGTAATLVAERPGAVGSEAMRRDIETTRAAIDEKLGALEDKVHTVQAKAKQMLDLRYQVEQHPWAVLGASVAAGFVAGSLGHIEAEEDATPISTDAAGMGQHRRARPRTLRRELFGTLKLAVGAALMELARQGIHRHMPTLGVQLDKVWEGRGMTSVSAARALIGADRPTTSQESESTKR